MTPDTVWPDTATLFRIDGDIALVTGSGSGIGRGIATMLAAGGASVVAVDRDAATAAATAAFIADHGGTAIGIGADITDELHESGELQQKLLDLLGESYATDAAPKTVTLVS